MKEIWKRYINTNLVEFIPPTSLGFKVALISSITLTLLFNFWDYVALHHELIRNLGLVCAALVGFPMLIWRTRIADRQAATGEASHTAETYTKAIEQLGAKSADGKPSMELRLGGMYALENIARTNEKYHPQIIEVLCAYVRMHAPKPVEAPCADELDRLLSSGDLVLAEGERPPSLDIQTALTIIGRRNIKFDGAERLNLTRTGLAGYQLAKVNFARVALSDADLIGADLRDADLRGADLICANLAEANLTGADLTEANLFAADLFLANLSKSDLSGARFSSAVLKSAKLVGAILFGANFSNAVLCDANLAKASLIMTDFNSADLTYANLTGADLTGADLTGADLTGTKVKRANIENVYPVEKRNELLSIMQRREGARDQQENSNL